MARYLFIAILFLHGLIHLVGFNNAFQFSSSTMINRSIPRIEGLGWLLATILFLVSGSLLLASSKSWPLFAFAAVLLSQILIITVWKDAKPGTLINFLVIVAAIISFANTRFQRMAEGEAIQLLSRADNKTDTIIGNQERLESIPPMVVAWLRKSGALDHGNITSIKLEQKGQMRMKPAGKWVSFQSTQYVNTVAPAFIWNARVSFWPMIYLNGRDKLENGQGAMLIKALSLFNVVNEKAGPQLNQGTLMRYLSEMMWYPQTALNRHVHWRTLDDSRAEATLETPGLSVSGIFSFDQHSLPVSFTCRRYYGGGKDAKLQDWTVHAGKFQDMAGMLIPTDCTVTWELPSGRFEWLRLSIVTLELNPVDVSP